MSVIFIIFIISTALVLSVMGLLFTIALPGIDRRSKRFFQCYFIVFMLNGLLSLTDTLLFDHPVPRAAIHFLVILECLFLSLPLSMLTVYLLHCFGETIRRSKLFFTVLCLWAVYVVLLAGAAFINIFSYVASVNYYYRGPLYPLLILPLIAILLVNLAGVIRRRKELSHKVFLSFLIAILPITVTLILQLFIEVMPLVDISFVISALTMYTFILSDQNEQNLRREREIARQQQEIAHQRASVMVLQMRPHFIFNTLMSIYSLCNQDPQKARQVTMDFTNYLRNNFSAIAADSTIPFTTELEHTRAYLAVEHVQFEEMLVVDYDIQFVNFRLPPLTLQPIVENAVKHGMNPYSGPLHISIRTRHTDSDSVITVTDNGPGFDPSDKIMQHTTLENILQRLEMMCAGKLEVTPEDGGGTMVTVIIPDRIADASDS